MKLNCEVGDLAVIVRSDVIANIGVFVRIAGVNAAATVFHREHCWDVIPSHPVRTDTGTLVSSGACRDSGLRPIRDQPGEDEVLRIACRPIGKEVTV